MLPIADRQTPAATPFNPAESMTAKRLRDLAKSYIVYQYSKARTQRGGATMPEKPYANAGRIPEMRRVLQARLDEAERACLERKEKADSRFRAGIGRDRAELPVSMRTELDEQERDYRAASESFEREFNAELQRLRRDLEA